MKHKKNSIDRRTVLKGAGVLVALPLLEIMMPSFLKAQSAPKPFIINMVWPNGLPSHYMNTSDTNYIYEYYLKNMSPALRASASMINSCHNWAYAWSGTHYGNSIGTYTGGINLEKYKNFLPERSGGAAYALKGRTGEDFMLESYDQRIAREFNLKTLNATIAPGAASIEDYGSINLLESISWKKNPDGNTHSAIHLDRNPRELFDRLVGAKVLTDASSVNARRQLLLRRDTVLSSVMEDVKNLQKKLGYEDKIRLDNYLTNVRELDNETLKGIADIANNNQPVTKSCGEGMTAPSNYGSGNAYSYNTDYFAKLSLFRDLMTLSMECGQHHIHCLSMAGSGSGVHLQTAQEFGGNVSPGERSWHSVSHWSDSSDKNLSRKKNVEYIFKSIDTFKGWMETLAQKKQPDGSSLLDNTFANITSYMGTNDNSGHDWRNIPVLMAGNAGGRIPKHNGFKFNSPTGGVPKGNIWLSVLQSLGINETKFGHATGASAKPHGGSTGTIQDFNKAHNS